MGTRSIFMSLFLKDWVRTQHKYLRNNFYPHDKNQAVTAVTNLSRLLSQIPHQLWDIRNSEAHAPPTSEAPGYRRLHLLSQVESLYEKEEQVLYIDKHFFQTPLSEMKTRSNTQLKQYYTYYEPLISKSIEQALDMGPNFKPIHAYFPPPATPTPIQPTEQDTIIEDAQQTTH